MNDVVVACVDASKGVYAATMGEVDEFKRDTDRYFEVVGEEAASPKSAPAPASPPSTDRRWHERSAQKVGSCTRTPPKAPGRFRGNTVTLRPKASSMQPGLHR